MQGKTVDREKVKERKNIISYIRKELSEMNILKDPYIIWVSTTILRSTPILRKQQKHKK